MEIKYCKECGKRLELLDWYSYISTKYCPACAKEVRRRNNANHMRELRAKASERRKLEKQRLNAVNDENAILRQIVAEQKRQLEAAKAELRRVTE